MRFRAAAGTHELPILGDDRLLAPCAPLFCGHFDRALDFALPTGFSAPRLFAPGILVVTGPRHAQGRDEQDPRLEELARFIHARRETTPGLDGFPLLCVTDDSDFTCASWSNFLWVVFTRSDPATDMYGAGAFTRCKHWGCQGPLVIDARLKTYHAPPLEPDPAVEKRVDALGAPGGPLHGII